MMGGPFPQDDDEPQATGEITTGGLPRQLPPGGPQLSELIIRPMKGHPTVAEVILNGVSLLTKGVVIERRRNGWPIARIGVALREPPELIEVAALTNVEIIDAP